MLTQTETTEKCSAWPVPSVREICWYMLMAALILFFLCVPIRNKHKVPGTLLHEHGAKQFYRDRVSGAENNNLDYFGQHPLQIAASQTKVIKLGYY